jgi:hypothetical protein
MALAFNPGLARVETNEPQDAREFLFIGLSWTTVVDLSLILLDLVGSGAGETDDSRLGQCCCYFCFLLSLSSTSSSTT